MSFWHTLPKPILALAPMANVTDAAFRRVIAEKSRHIRSNGTEGGPDVFWTEFVSADGLMRATPEGKEKLMADLLYSEAERPIVGQLFSAHPEYMEKAAHLVAGLGFDGIDINMGCPDRAIERQGCGAAMMKHPDIARAVIRAAKKGAGDVPVSIKTRIGYYKNELASWLPSLLAEYPDAITIHARTRKEMSKVPARWEHVREAVAIRDMVQHDIPETERTRILGNGDVYSRADGIEKVTQSGADGVMFGRAIFGNPWFFNQEKDAREIPIDEKLRVLVAHARLYETLLPHKSFAFMKKHCKAYVHEFDGARELRAQLMDTNTADEMETVVNTFCASSLHGV